MRKVAFWLSLILIFVIPWEDMLSFGASGTTVARVIGNFVAMFWIITVIVSGKFRKPNLFHLMVIVFVLWNAMSVFWSVDVEKTVAKLITYTQTIALVLIIWDLYTTKTALKAGLQAYILGAYVSIGSTIINYLAGIEESFLRYAATGFNANDLGVRLALGIPVAWYLAISDGNDKTISKLRLVNYAFIPAAVLGILLTASRTAFLASLPALLFVLASTTRINLSRRFLTFTILIVTLFTVQSLVPQYSIQRLGTIGTSIIEGDIGDRVAIWREGIAVFSEHPLYGIGSGAFRTISVSDLVAHNTYLSVLVEVGMIGFALFVIILALTVYRIMHQPRWEKRLWLAILLVGAVAISVGTWEHKKPTWLFLSLVVVSAGLPVRSDKPTIR